MRRKSLGKKKRFEVFKRDKFRCQYCGRRVPDVVLQVDHILPVAEGGDDDYGNLITSCFDCNGGKGATLLEDSDCERVQQMQVETIAQLAAFNAMLLESVKVSDEQHEWLANRVASALDIFIAGQDAATLRVFARRMPIDEIVDCADLTGSRYLSSPSSRWRYFCGCCWRRIKRTEAE